MDEQAVRDYFDSVAASYAQKWTDIHAGYPLVKLRGEYAVKWFAERAPRNGRVLDLGCGPGYLLERLVEAGYRVHGVDLSPAMVEEARRRLVARGFEAATYAVEVGDVTCWHPPVEFDGVAALGVLEYLPEDGDVLRVVNRALRPGGCFIVECRNRLFNLVSLNRYTRDVIQANEYLTLLHEYELLLNSSILRWVRDVSDDLVAAIKEAWCGATKVGEPAAQVHIAENAQAAASQAAERTEASFGALARRQHSPLRLAEVARGYGFELVYLRFLHFHPFAPVFEHETPMIFRQLGLVLELLGETAAAATMSSSFLAGFEKRTEVGR